MDKKRRGFDATRIHGDHFRFQIAARGIEVGRGRVEIEPAGFGGGPGKTDIEAEMSDVELP